LDPQVAGLGVAPYLGRTPVEHLGEARVPEIVGEHAPAGDPGRGQMLGQAGHRDHLLWIEAKAQQQVIAAPPHRAQPDGIGGNAQLPEIELVGQPAVLGRRAAAAQANQRGIGGGRQDRCEGDESAGLGQAPEGAPLARSLHTLQQAVTQGIEDDEHDATQARQPVGPQLTG
jgi:hypothetical protein